MSFSLLKLTMRLARTDSTGVSELIKTHLYIFDRNDFNR